MSKTDQTAPLACFVLAKAGLDIGDSTLEEMKEYVSNSEFPTEFFKQYGLAQDNLRRAREARGDVRKEQNGTRRSKERKFCIEAKDTPPKHREDLDFSYQDKPLRAEMFHRI